jgi:hypothetical protein
MHRIVPFTAYLTALACVILLAGLLPASCRNSHNTADAETSAVIVGTVLDAATGKPVEGARVEGPGGRKTRSDQRGRFELRGLGVGTTGEVRASTGDGKSGSVSLRRLSAGRLEIVLHVKRA